jgi:hypothetical protein
MKDDYSSGAAIAVGGWRGDIGSVHFKTYKENLRKKGISTAS